MTKLKRRSHPGRQAGQAHLGSADRAASSRLLSELLSIETGRPIADPISHGRSMLNNFIATDRASRGRATQADHHREPAPWTNWVEFALS